MIGNGVKLERVLMHADIQGFEEQHGALEVDIQIRDAPHTWTDLGLFDCKMTTPLEVPE